MKNLLLLLILYSAIYSQTTSLDLRLKHGSVSYFKLGLQMKIFYLYDDKFLAGAGYTSFFGRERTNLPEDIFNLNSVVKKKQIKLL